ncbi:hypothetical protein FBZ94_103651 [Bradyrhizobium sacchari]|nr:hypothetical protein FBZ94_103651 [Bradyrhizobium sacchari]
MPLSDLGSSLGYNLCEGAFGYKHIDQPAAEGLRNGTWPASGHSLSVAKLVSIPAQFVPADNADSVPVNRVLKNNFYWCGSHVFEWVDTTKTRLKAFFDDPPALQELSEAVRKHAPIRLPVCPHALVPRFA